MKHHAFAMLAFCAILLLGCGGGESHNDTSSGNKADSESAVSAGQAGQQGGIVGEWEQKFSCFDKNGNYRLDADEKKPADTTIGFDWFRFNADGTCQWDKDIKWEGTWSIDETTSKKKVMIKGGDSFKYSIEELTDEELVLGASGAFNVFKRVK